MPYPANHLYLTLHWVPLNSPLEYGQTGLRFDTQAAATQALVDACLAPCNTFFSSVGAAIGISYGLKFIRLARLGPDGKYIPGSVAYDAANAGNGAQGGGANMDHPLQIACASTLVTASPRGQASHGRMFFPPISTVVAADNRWTAVQADARSTALATMVKALSTALGGPAAVMSKGTVRSSTGLSQAVTGVKTGRRPDVQRRRAKALTELYGATKPLV